MESLNHTLFLWLNAPEHPNAWVLALAIFFAKHLIWAVPLAISIGWLRGHEGTRKAMLVATAAGVLGLLINQAIGLALAGVPIAWARIYLGVHFPFDMLGAIAVAAVGAWLALRAVRWYLEPGYQFAAAIHHRLFGKLIALGWVRA